MRIVNLSNGGISIADTDDMPIHTRKFILNTYLQAKEALDKKREELRAEREQNARNAISKAKSRSKRKRNK